MGGWGTIIEMTYDIMVTIKRPNSLGAVNAGLDDPLWEPTRFMKHTQADAIVEEVRKLLNERFPNVDVRLERFEHR